MSTRTPVRVVRESAVAAVRYRIAPIDLKGHYFEVVCDVREPDPAGQRLTLPAWIPGSYMIREFARHIVAIDAVDANRGSNRKLALSKLDKHTWQAEPCAGALVVRYACTRGTRRFAPRISTRATHSSTAAAYSCALPTTKTRHMRSN